MKNFIIKTFALAVLLGGVSACGDNYLQTRYYRGIDVATGLNSVLNISTALNGVYYRNFAYQFAGNYATNIGDIPTDITYFNGNTGHWSDIYRYNVTPVTDLYIRGAWEYGYRVVDNASRVIKASNELLAAGDLTADETKELNLVLAEAHALRGYAQLVLVNIFGHQIKVNGTDHSSTPGIVVVTDPIPVFTEVSRATVGESYTAILADFTKSLSQFQTVGEDRGELFYMSVAAVNGLMARTHLYMENWSAAITSAQAALNAAGNPALAYTADAYKALYNTASSNTESIFALAISSSNAWSSDSSGTLWSSYNMSPSPKLLGLYGANDCRTSVHQWSESSTETVPQFAGGKFSHYSSGNPAYATNNIVNAPEMHLIIAEANLKNDNLDAAKEALLVVAKRNSSITSVADLPSDAAGLLAFLKDERARELFQEGLRLWDLRRWDERVGVYAIGAPNVSYTFNNYQISNLIFPIPGPEVTSGWGVTQNDYIDTFPK